MRMDLRSIFNANFAELFEQNLREVPINAGALVMFTVSPNKISTLNGLKRTYDYVPVSYTHLTLPTNREV